MFYGMNSKVMFTATALILVAAIVTVAMSSAVYANPPHSIIQYCQKGHEGDPTHCAPTRELCKQIVVAPGESGKCVRVATK